MRAIQLLIDSTGLDCDALAVALEDDALRATVARELCAGYGRSKEAKLRRLYIEEASVLGLRSLEVDNHLAKRLSERSRRPL